MQRVMKLIIFIGLLYLTTISFSEGHIDAAEKNKKEAFSLPKNVMSISKSNTFPNTTEDLEIIEPNDETKDLLNSIEMAIENPELIQLMNDTTIKPTPFAIGYRANIYLGRWPLHYRSESTTVNWDYQHINKSEINNFGGKEVQEARYIQQKKASVRGALTNKISQPETIKKLILHHSKEKTKLPLSFTAVVGENTKLDNYYHVPVKKIGHLNAYMPAINEKGKIVFGEVYIQLKGSKKELEIKNVTKQSIGAWIPIQDHVSLDFQLK